MHTYQTCCLIWAKFVIRDLQIMSRAFVSVVKTGTVKYILFLRMLMRVYLHLCCLCNVSKVKNTFLSLCTVQQHTPCAVFLFAVVTFNIVDSWIHTHTHIRISRYLMAALQLTVLKSKS